MLLQNRDWRVRGMASAVLVAAAALAGCGGGGGVAADNSVKAPTSLPAAVAKAKSENTAVNPALVAADNTFGLSALQALQAQHTSLNMTISPLSLSLALQILYNGAAGTTQKAMTQTLKLGTLTTQQINDANAALQATLSSADPQAQLTIANSLWLHLHDSTIVPTFSAMDQNYYGATIGDLAGAPDNVNAWVNDQTHGLIPSILPKGDYSKTTAIIANAVYFKGEWTAPFDPNNTQSASFTLSDGTSAPAHMMHQDGTFAYLRGPDFQMVSLPYGQGRMSMLIVLPDPGISLGSLLANMSAPRLAASAAQMQDAYGRVALPKFTASSDSDMPAVLKAMGMGIAFSCPDSLAAGPVADFSALTSARVCVTSVKHNAWIQVDELGTVAAATTTIGVGTTAVRALQFTMNMDHPFLYAIRDDDTGTLLFMGTLQDPSK